MLDTPPEQPRAAPVSNPMTFGAGRTKAHSHAELSDEWMTEVRGGARTRLCLCTCGYAQRLSSRGHPTSTRWPPCCMLVLQYGAHFR